MPHRLSAALERLADRYQALFDELHALQGDLHAIETENVHLRARIDELERQLRRAVGELAGGRSP